MTYLIVVLAVLARFAPHPPNFTPAFGVLLFGGAYLKRRDSIWFPVALLALSDLVLTTWVYGMRVSWSEPLDWLGFALIALLGLWLRSRISARNVVAASLAGPTAFFLVSNFGVWLGWRMYPPTWAGLIACYVAALPFFGNSLVASVLYSGLLFSAYGIWRRKFASGRLDGLVADRR
jgi:uncharacterized protein DUF6580